MKTDVMSSLSHINMHSADTWVPLPSQKLLTLLQLLPVLIWSIPLPQAHSPSQVLIKITYFPLIFKFSLPHSCCLSGQADLS